MVEPIALLERAVNATQTTLDVSGRGLRALDLSAYPKLQMLDCSNNQLTALDLSNTPDLKVLRCFNNQLVELNL